MAKNTLNFISTGPPTIVMHPADHVIIAGETITLDCKGIGIGPIIYEWQRKYLGQSQWKSVGRRTTDQISVLIPNIRQSEQYRCIVSNKAGSTRSDVATITIMGKLFYQHQCDI